MRYIVLAMLAVVLGLALQARPKQVDESAVRKAKYVFYEATSQREKGNFDSYYNLIKYAHSLDTTNTAIGFYYGVAIMTSDTKDESLRNYAVKLMRRHVDACPTDFNEANYYMSVCVDNPKLWSEAKRVAIQQAKLYPDRDDVLQRLAYCYSREGLTDSVLAIYSRLEQRLGLTANIVQVRAATYEAAHNDSASLNEWRRFQASAPHDADANTMLANKFLELSYLDSAYYYLNRALEYEPNDGFTNFSLANYYATINDSVKYENAIYRTLTECDLDIEMKLRVMQQYTAQRISERDSSARVDALFQRMIDMHPNEVLLHTLYYSYLSIMNRSDEALEQAEVSLDLEPNDFETWRRALSATYIFDRYDKTRQLVTRALDTNGDNAELVKFVAEIQLAIKDYKPALATYDRLWTLAGDDNEQKSDVMGGRADVYVAMGDTVQAVEAYEKALELNKGNVGIMNNYAYCLACGKMNLDYALELISRAVHAEPENASFLDTYAWIYYQRGEPVMALLYVESALAKTETPNAEIYEHYGDILLQNGREADAVKQWQNAIANYNDSYDKPGTFERLEKKIAEHKSAIPDETPAKQQEEDKTVITVVEDKR